MTCALSITNMHDALYNAARKYPGGIESLAGRLEVSPGTLYNKLRRQVDTHQTSFEEAAVIMEHLAEASRPDAFAALHSMAWRLQHVAVELPDIVPDADPVPIMQQLCHTFKEGGDVAQAIERSLADDQWIDAHEYELIDTEIMEAVTELIRLREMCRRKYGSETA